MEFNADNFDRTVKFFVDRDDAAPTAIRNQLRTVEIAVVCGPEVQASKSLQVAALTALNVGKRCFGGRLTLQVEPSGWSEAELAQFRTAATTNGAEIADFGSNSGLFLNLGTCPKTQRGLQGSFDGWVAGVSPATSPNRMREREMCPVVGVALGALAIGEIFNSISRIAVEAMKREVGLSLWRPDLEWNDEDAVGQQVVYLPEEYWLMGLGHLGQAFAWAINSLPYLDRSRVAIALNDFDKVVQANLGTSMLAKEADIGRRKTRVVGSWLENEGFTTILVERPFDETFRVRDDEPALALCGFDGNGPRWAIDGAGFASVVECGLGGQHHNFDAISIHSFPGAMEAREIWSRERGDRTEAIHRLIEHTDFYRDFRDVHKCGHIELAGKSVSVPFVGAAAAAFVIAETLRNLNCGPVYDFLELTLSDVSPSVRPKLCSQPKPQIRFQHVT